MYVLLVHVVSCMGGDSVLEHGCVLGLQYVYILVGVSSVSMLLCLFGCGLLVRLVASSCCFGVQDMGCCFLFAVQRILSPYCTGYVLYLDCLVRDLFVRIMGYCDIVVWIVVFLMCIMLLCISTVLYGW